jgi:hypothetical protein
VRGRADAVVADCRPALVFVCAPAFLLAPPDGREAGGLFGALARGVRGGAFADLAGGWTTSTLRFLGAGAGGLFGGGTGSGRFGRSVRDDDDADADADADVHDAASLASILRCTATTPSSLRARSSQVGSVQCTRARSNCAMLSASSCWMHAHSAFGITCMSHKRWDGSTCGVAWGIGQGGVRHMLRGRQRARARARVCVCVCVCV